jgi:hypothetical protein
MHLISHEVTGLNCGFASEIVLKVASIHDIYGMLYYISIHM